MKTKIKQLLYKKLNHEQPYENSINISLISNYSELREILNTIENKTKFFYMDNKAIYEIMYQEEQVIPIENKKYEYSFIYYISLLIKENKEMVNFNFGLNFIKEIDNENNNQENELQKLFVSRIILDLIYSYEGIEKNEELKKIKEKNKMYVRDNIIVFNKYNLKLENIEEISLGKLYLEILIELIKNKKLENYEFANDMLTKLDFQNIDINQYMFEELHNILDDERYIKDYKMNNIKDFFVEAKINFYYILIKYIFKNYFFIYNIPLLYNTRNTIIKIIKTQKEDLSKYNIGNFDLNKRIIYNIKFFLNSNYYYNIFIDINFDNILEEGYKNNSENWKEYMEDLNISEKYIDKMAIIIYIYESKTNNNEKIELKEITKAYKQQEKMIKDKKIKKMRKDYRFILSKYFLDNKNKDSLLRLFGQDSYDFFLNESIQLNEIEKKEKIEKKNKLKQILEYYKTFFFESKKEDISSIENAINDHGDLDYKKYEPDFEKAKMLNERMPLINYLYKIKDENNKTESEMQQIIEKYNSVEKFISEKNSMKDINIENETKSLLFDYFNDKNNEGSLIKIFGKENYDFSLKYLSEKILDDKIIDNNEEISTDKFDKNIKPNYNGIKNQYNIENDSSNLLNASTKMNSKNIPMEITNNSEQAKSFEEKLAYRLLKKSGVIINTRKEGEKLSFFFESLNYGDSHIFISYDKSLKIKEYFITNKIESIIAKSYVKYMEFLDEFKNRIKKEFTNEYQLKIGLEFKIIDNTNNDSIYNINCNYKFYSPDLNVASNQIFKEENILLNKTNSKTQGFEYLIYEINQEYFKQIKFVDNSPKETNETLKNDNKTNIDDNLEATKKSLLISSTNESKYNNNYNDSKKYNIVIYNKNIGNGHKSTAEFIIELSNGYFVSAGTDNVLKIYDKEFMEIKEIQIKEWIYSCFEKGKAANQKKKNDYNIELVACCLKKMYQVILTFKDKENIKFQLNKYEISNVTSKTCTQMRENIFVINGHSNSFLTFNLFNCQEAQLVNSSLVSEKSYIGSIRISQNIIAITSNKVQYNGEDKLIFYNIEKKKISREIEGFSFISRTNSLALMPREEIKVKNKILLCACTKYLNDQKNGIYLANPQLEDNKLVNNPFYDTGNFEVFCFCPILNINLDNNILGDESKIKIEDTIYFFVGGYNSDKKEGEIKLFKVIYSEKAYNNKIKFVQDIEFERNKDFTGFEGAVCCIKQIKKNNNYLGNILVTCYSGKIYLLSEPNLDAYKEAKNTNSII